MAQPSLDYDPLVDPQRNLVFFWSPRCGSSTLNRWFFRLVGWGERLKHTGSHALRASWADSTRELLDDEHYLYHDQAVRRIVVARNPYSRAVSLYYLSLASQAAITWAVIADAVPGADETRRLTWREWLDFLESQDLATCDINWRLQSARRWYELGVAVEMVRTERLSEALMALSAELEADIPVVRVNTTPRAEAVSEGVDVQAMTKPELTSIFGLEGSRLRLPPESMFLDEVSRKRIAHMYEQDFDALGYERQD